MNPLSMQMGEEARRMAKVLAEKWGLPEQRFWACEAGRYASVNEILELL